MAQLQLQGNLTLSQVVNGGFPGENVNIPLSTTPDPKSCSSYFASGQQSFSSPSSPLALSGIGTNQTVSSATYFQFRCNAPITLVITYVNGISTTVSTNYVDGLFISEPPSANLITSVTAQGSGTIEYIACSQ